MSSGNEQCCVICNNTYVCGTGALPPPPPRGVTGLWSAEKVPLKAVSEVRGAAVACGEEEAAGRRSALIYPHRSVLCVCLWVSVCGCQFVGVSLWVSVCGCQFVMFVCVSLWVSVCGCQLWVSVCGFAGHPSVACVFVRKGGVVTLCVHTYFLSLSLYLCPSLPLSLARALSLSFLFLSLLTLSFSLSLSHTHTLSRSTKKKIRIAQSKLGSMSHH
jgi:hypothetical protein